MIEKKYLIFIITLCVFLVEDLLHFTIGYNSGRKGFRFVLPNPRDFFYMLIVLSIFSAIDFFIIDKVVM
jgi:uncharacterized membrane protein